jgi:hypothetical protein
MMLLLHAVPSEANVARRTGTNAAAKFRLEHVIATK